MTTPAAERMRRMRARRQAKETAPPILFERADWRLFLDQQTLPQKAGCEPDQIGRVILKELVDNALDCGADKVSIITGDKQHCTVTDNGPGLSYEDMLAVFAVNRPLRSSKLVRLPTRGMLGNGLRVVMGAVAAFGGSITVTTRGCAYKLAPDSVTGATKVLASTPADEAPGLTVKITFPRPLFTTSDFSYALNSIILAQKGHGYTGPSQSGWYSPEALCELLNAAPNGTPLDKVIESAFGFAGTKPELSAAWAARFIAEHASAPCDVGEIGREPLGGYYRKVTGVAEIDGAKIPYCVEVSVEAEAAEKNEDVGYTFSPYLNRSQTLARIAYHADSTGLRMNGCGLDFKVSGPKRADYTFVLSLITPYLRLTGDGKAPFLGHFTEAIEEAVKAAASQAYRNVVRPAAAVSIKDAAYQVMEEAYMKASDNGSLPAKSRQVMYAARGKILELTGREKFSDDYFTQTLLPDYQQDFPEETADWDVIYDARGALTEPHTEVRVPLGTLQVRQYLGERPSKPGRPQLNAGALYPTTGPRNRYRNLLFVEKEGFDELWDAVQLAERYDLAIMSTKGMSVIAARRLIDALAPCFDNILVMHDLDVSGFSIFGTLGTDSRRYKFETDLNGKIHDIGLRLTDVEAMRYANVEAGREAGLESEVVKVDSREARRVTLAWHGATDEEIQFLAPEDERWDCRRIELNAMTSRQLVDFVEGKLQEHGVEKVIPDDAVLLEHARHLVETKLSDELLAQHAEDIARQAAAQELPPDLAAKVAELLEGEPELSWDQALARIV
jgi:hypothetical protein